MKSLMHTDPVGQFGEKSAWARWLAEEYASSKGIWLRLSKKGAEESTLTYAEAVETALTYGWIDGQKRSDNEHYWLQRFTPRSRTSIWSKINCAKAEALMANGAMLPPGLAEVERAKSDGRWDRAYDGARVAAIPADFQAALDANPEAQAFFLTVNASNRYAILFRVQTAKQPKTRATQIERLVRMLQAQETLHPQKADVS